MLNQCQIDPWGGEGEAASRVRSGGSVPNKPFTTWRSDYERTAVAVIRLRMQMWILTSPHIARYCDTIAAIPHIAQYLFGEVSIPPKWCDTHPWYLISHRHICAIPQFATYRAISVRYPIETSTKQFCDTIATRIARYEKYRCWASKDEPREFASKFWPPNSAFLKHAFREVTSGFCKGTVPGAPPRPSPKPLWIPKNNSKETHSVPPEGHLLVKNMWSDSQVVQRYRTRGAPFPVHKAPRMPKNTSKKRTWYQARRHVCAKARLRNPDQSQKRCCELSAAKYCWHQKHYIQKTIFSGINLCNVIDYTYIMKSSRELICVM